MASYYSDNKNPIATARRNKNISQEELADILEITRSSLSRYENGNDIPSSLVIKLASELDVSTDYILGISHNETKNNENLWKEFALEDECIEKIRTIAHIGVDRNYTLAIDTINYLFKYSNIELIEFVGEYLNVPLPNNINYKINGRITHTDKRMMNEQRKYEVEKFIVLQEISKLFDQIKASDEVKEKYNKYKKHIDTFDRPINKATSRDLKRLEIE